MCIHSAHDSVLYYICHDILCTAQKIYFDRLEHPKEAKIQAWYLAAVAVVAPLLLLVWNTSAMSGPGQGCYQRSSHIGGRVSSLLIGQLIAFLISDWLIVSTDKNPNNTVTNQSTAQRFFQDSRLENSFRHFIQRFIHFHLSVKVTGRVSRVLRIGRERLKLFL